MSKAHQFMTLSSLAGTHEGRTGDTWLAELSRIVDDCKKRPDLKKARTLTMQINVRPDETDKTGDLTYVDYDVVIKPAKLPEHKRGSERARVQKNGQLALLFGDEAA